ncbi:unnamed protein product [Aphanomyces euteiches]|uniref:Polycystin cation channel PKD1/PKD2 domain-containing protein n=1 Tax=Aphanomyces euteiches TaxID=100861 RepID=A0A6G0XKU8_9STRA|nr:hypothetical protein Ae201684_003623 [Aphanomyces euteiches]KAH9084626.1 hypothetical protein Ae201684P_001868 [Aphanomyces euteiches]
MASNPSTVTTPSINEILQEMKHMNDDDIKLSFPEAVHALKARAELRLHFVYLPIPMAFFILFAWTALVHVPIQHMFPAELGLETTLVSMGTDAITPNTTMKFKNIQTQADVFAWLLDTFVPSVFVTTDYNGNNFTDAILLRRIDGFNKILGAVEFKTTRASPMRCDADKHLATLFPTCHDFLHPVDMEPVYIDATVDAATASLILQAKQISGTWINTSTTSLIVNVATFNGELNVLCITSLKILFQNGGAIDTQFTMSAVPSDPYHGHWSGGPIALDAFVGLLFVLTLAKEFYLIYRSIRDKTLISVVWDAWRIIEWASLGFVALFYILWAFLCVNIYDKDIVTHLKALDGGTNHDITTLETLMTKLTYMGRVMVSIRLSAMTALFLLVARIMGAVRFHPHLNLVTATLTASLHSLGSFSLIFFTCLAAFVTSGVVLFGERLVQFSTIGRATVTVINMLFGQFDLSAILEVDYHIGVVWYWCAMIILFLMLFNMLLAIVLAAFDDVRSRSRADRNVFEEFFIIAKEVLHVTTVSDKFKTGVSDGTLHRLDPRAVAEFLRIKESHAREFLREMKILSRAGADLSGEAINVDQGRIDNQLAVEDRLSKIEDLLAKVASKLDNCV